MHRITIQSCGGTPTRGFRPTRLNTLFIQAHLACQHGLAGRALEAEFEVVQQTVTRPEGKGAYAGLDTRKLGDEGVTYMQRGGQVADQGAEKLITRDRGKYPRQ
jgi:hypothetical protein